MQLKIPPGWINRRRYRYNHWSKTSTHVHWSTPRHMSNYLYWI